MESTMFLIAAITLILLLVFKPKKKITPVVKEGFRVRIVEYIGYPKEYFEYFKTENEANHFVDNFSTNPPEFFVGKNVKVFKDW